MRRELARPPSLGHPDHAPFAHLALPFGYCRDGVPDAADAHRGADVVLGVAIPRVPAAAMVAALVRELFWLGCLDAGNRHLGEGRRADGPGRHPARNSGGLWAIRFALARSNPRDVGVADADYRAGHP